MFSHFGVKRTYPSEHPGSLGRSLNVSRQEDMFLAIAARVQKETSSGCYMPGPMLMTEATSKCKFSTVAASIVTNIMDPYSYESYRIRYLE